MLVVGVMTKKTFETSVQCYAWISRLSSVYFTDVCSAMIECNDMLTICDNVHHPELQLHWLAHCTRVLYPH